MRYDIELQTNSGVIVLGDTRLDRAREYARRISEGGGYRIIDTFDGEVMDDSRGDGGVEHWKFACGIVLATVAMFLWRAFARGV